MLVSGKQSLRQSDIDTIIKFYEWAFDTTFSDSERERFQDLSVQAFHQDPAGSRKAADVLITAYEKVQLKNEADQSKLRATFNDSFIKDLRATNDEASALLLEIYDRTHAGADTNMASTDPEPAKYQADTSDQPRSSASLSAIVGKWGWSKSGSMTKTVTGVYLGGSGSRFTYEISPNGTVVFEGIMSTMTGGCQLVAYNTARGRASLSGDRLTITFGPTSFSRTDTCSPSKNYKKTLPPKQKPSLYPCATPTAKRSSASKAKMKCATARRSRPGSTIDKRGCLKRQPLSIASSFSSRF